MDLTTNAEMLDDNKVLHVLIRLTMWHDRQNVKSALGGCMLLLFFEVFLSEEASTIVRRSDAILKVILNTAR